MRLTTIILTLAIGALGACDLAQSPIGPSIDTPTQETPVIQVDMVEAAVVTQPTNQDDPQPPETVPTSAPTTTACINQDGRQDC